MTGQIGVSPVRACENPFVPVKNPFVPVKNPSIKKRLILFFHVKLVQQFLNQTLWGLYVGAPERLVNPGGTLWAWCEDALK